MLCVSWNHSQLIGKHQDVQLFHWTAGLHCATIQNHWATHMNKWNSNFSATGFIIDVDYKTCLGKTWSSCDTCHLLSWCYSTFEAVLPSIMYDLFIFVSTHNKRWVCTGKWVSTAECQEEKGQLFVFLSTLPGSPELKNIVKPSNIFCLLQFIQLLQSGKHAHPTLGVKLKLKRVPSCFWLPQQKLYPRGWMVVGWYGTQLTCQLTHILIV